MGPVAAVVRLVRVTVARLLVGDGGLYAWSSDGSLSMRGYLVFLVSDSACFRRFSSVYKEACITVRNDLGTGMMERVERLCMMKFVLYQVRSLAYRGSAWFLWPSNGA